MSPQTVLFFGRVGSGKGTQSELLMKFLKSKDPNKESIYIETGQKLREFVGSNNSYSSKLTKNVMDSGGLMPAFVPIWLWTTLLVNNFTGEEHLVFDGVCRRPYEFPVLDSALKFYKRDGARVVVIDTSKEWSIQRAMDRKRGDDEMAEIKKRLEWFDSDASLAIKSFENDSYYGVVHINGEQTIENVHKEVLEKLGW